MTADNTWTGLTRLSKHSQWPQYRKKTTTVARPVYIHVDVRKCEFFSCTLTRYFCVSWCLFIRLCLSMWNLISFTGDVAWNNERWCCLSGRSVSAAVCGSDGVIYPSECHLRQHSCRLQIDIHPSSSARCRGKLRTGYSSSGDAIGWATKKSGWVASGHIDNCPVYLILLACKTIFCSSL